jgi:hypothetical protein
MRVPREVVALQPSGRVGEGRVAGFLLGAAGSRRTGGPGRSGTRGCAGSELLLGLDAFGDDFHAEALRPISMMVRTIVASSA